MQPQAASAETLVAEMAEFSVFPEVATRVLALLADGESDTQQLARQIETDPGVMGSLLRLANSPLFGLRRRVETVSQAITVVGRTRLRDLVTLAGSVQAFAHLPNRIVALCEFWHHSLLCALAAQRLAARVLPQRSGALFVAGMLHDVGVPLIYRALPEQAEMSLALVREAVEEPQIHEAERLVLGFDHAEVGGLLAERWGLSAALVASIRWHHDPERAEPALQTEVALVHVANSLAILAELDSQEWHDAPPVNPLCWRWCGLEPAEVLAWVGELQAEFAQLAEGLGFLLSDSAPCP